jgi:hypothetical protein
MSYCGWVKLNVVFCGLLCVLAKHLFYFYEALPFFGLMVSRHHALQVTICMLAMGAIPKH